MKHLIFILVILTLVFSQTVTPSTQACVCTNLLNQADCQTKSGCAWTATNSTNTTSTTTSGTCATSTTTTTVIPTYCGSITNSTLCANTIGCAYLNSTCTIFTGCTAYVQTTNAACQAISTQCTTDGTRCVAPGTCSSYTTQSLCTGNIATSGAKQCKWTSSGSSGTCGDLACTDAPSTYTTLAQCQSWISGCLSTGQGCTATLGLCSSYLQSAGCANLIGSDGICTTDSTSGSACRAIQCSDAATTLSTNAACNSFKTGCVTSGKGCVATLAACNTYSQTLGCTGLIGTDGQCIADQTTGATNCRAMVCTDAANTLVTDSQCNSFLTGCVTTGSGCISSRGTCSTYTGTQTTCASLIGSDGNCKGTSTTNASCSARLCSDAPTTLTTDSACSLYQNGCVTNGYGCVSSLGSCSSYTGTNTTCTQYKGTDGGCTAPSTQTTAANCVAVSCTDAPSTYTTNSQCQSFSYLCVTNGAGCILPGSCETRSSSLSCQGSSTCNSGTICMDRSSCANYTNFSLCTLNTQQYLPAGTTTYYSRPCTWTGSACTNYVCTSLSSSLTTDTLCNAQLSGCVTNGAGCVDISASCSTYSGTQSTCQNFKGSNGTKACTQLTTVSVATNCIERTCANASTASGVTQTSTTTCTAYLSGCYYNGNGGCTNQSCTTYFGTQAICSGITTAVNGSGAAQKCWQLASVTGTTTACTVKQCTDASNSLNSDALCQAFLSGCVTNGAGCISSSNACTAYTGNLQTCSSFNESTNHQCSKTQNFCKLKTCSDTIANPSSANCSAYLSSCIYMGSSCQAPQAACSSYTPTSGSELTQCQAVQNSSGVGCTYSSGANCTEKTCADSISSPSTSTCSAYLSSCTFVGTSCTAVGACATYAPTSGSEAAQCGVLVNTSNGKCGWASGANCKDRACGDVLVTPNVANCSAYISNCTFVGTVCVATGACNTYTPTAGSEQTQCQAISNSSGVACTWDGSSATCTEKTCGDTISSPSAATCNAYLSSCTFIGTACLAKAGCTTYTPTAGSEASQCAAAANASGVPCTYSSGSTCSERACTDTITSPSAATCTAYLSTCGFNGSSCVVASACSSYTLTSAATCNLATDGSGNFCGYQSNASNCSAKSCTDVISNPSAATCSAYLAGCLFNGTSCITPGNCNTYTLIGSTDQAKAAFCNALTGATTATKCTYISGSSTCQNASTCNTYALTSLTTCALTQDNSGNLCGYTASDSNCSTRTCPQQLTEASCSDSWLTGCIVNTTSNCASKACSGASTSLLTNTACSSYRSGCVTNGAGCIDSTSLCNAYQGTLTLCQTFTGADGPCTNAVSATSTTACIVRTCALNTVATTDAACETWLPTVNNVKNCVWNGTTGCIAATSNCSAFTGTIDSCPTITAADGPCSGTSSTASSCVSNSTICNQAPVSYTTDTQCKKWHSLCITNGFGCILQSTAKCTDIVSATICPTYKSALSCDLATTCSTKPSQCSGFTTAYDCNNVILTGTTPTCGWNGTSCVNLTCALLSSTYSTDTACYTALTGCTTNGAGCVVKGACSTYNKQACGVAATTDASKVCIWSNSTCRQIVCSDNTTATSDAACNTYLAGCRTTGMGCSSSLTCSMFTSAAFCLYDQTNNPCLWYKGACVNYTKCSDILGTTHSSCQAISSLCTTNGTNCVAITGCAQTLQQASCILGTDGNCGWLPATGTATAQCALYTNCAAATGTTTAQCQLWGSSCVSDGTACITKTTCSAYLTQTACGNAGTDGTCFYVAPTGTETVGTCRLQLCSDATTNLTTYAGCAAFSANTQCTTSGTACISLSTCSSYSVQAGCVQGTDGVCLWDSTSSACRLKVCTDSILTTNASCSSAITGVKCVSNGVNCIPKSTCSSYTAQTACLGGGTDGQCAFTPGTNATVGTCALFTSCSAANSDQTACQSRVDACYWNSTTSNGSTTTSCTAHTCATKSSGSSCQPIPSFDLSTYSICVLSGTTCASGNPTSLSSTTCFSGSQETYTWNPSTSACQSCVATTTSNSTNTTTNSTSDTYGYLVSILVTLVVLL